MDNAILRYVFDKNKQSSNDNAGLLQIEIREQGTKKCIYISTGIHLFKNQFSEKQGFTCVNHANASAITAKGRRIYSEIEKFVLSDKCKEIKDVKNRNDSGSNSEIIPFMTKQLINKQISDVTKKTHWVLIKKINQFDKIKSFKDLNYKNISEFDLFLRETISDAETLCKRHALFRSYINEAILLGYVDSDPYAFFKFPVKKTKEKIFLTQEEIEKIFEYSPDSDKMIRIKDLFLFQIFTGMAYSDMQDFTKEDIYEINGDKIIRSNRHKTDESFISLFLPEAEEIAKKYDYKLPKISNQKYNDYLKLLAAGSGINKNITSHVARHTYATYLINKGVSIETVSRAMGHSSIKMTQHYAKLLGKKVIEDMKKVFKQ